MAATVIAGSVARRYARALFTLALEAGTHEQTGEELEAAVRAVTTNPEATAIAVDPAASSGRRQALVQALVEAGKLGPVTGNFLRLLAERARLASLPAIGRAYRALLDEQTGRVRASVTSAVPLDDGQLHRLRETLAAATKKTIVLEAKTDPSIIGGIVAQVGARQFDGSLKTQLARLRDELKQSPIA